MISILLLLCGLLCGSGLVPAMTEGVISGHPSSSPIASGGLGSQVKFLNAYWTSISSIPENYYVDEIEGDAGTAIDPNSVSQNSKLPPGLAAILTTPELSNPGAGSVIPGREIPEDLPLPAVGDASPLPACDDGDCLPGDAVSGESEVSDTISEFSATLSELLMMSMKMNASMTISLDMPSETLEDHIDSEVIDSEDVDSSDEAANEDYYADSDQLEVDQEDTSDLNPGFEHSGFMLNLSRSEGVTISTKDGTVTITTTDRASVGSVDNNEDDDSEDDYSKLVKRSYNPQTYGRFHASGYGGYPRPVPYIHPRVFVQFHPSAPYQRFRGRRYRPGYNPLHRSYLR